jgi:hypothetical protein
MPTRFESKIIGRLLERLAKDGLNAALEYGIAVCGGNPQITRAVLSSAPEPLKTMLDASFAVKRSRQQIAHDAMAARQAQVTQARNLANEAFTSEFESARRIGQAAVFLTGLTMAERALCKATKNEVDAAIAMRRNCVRSTKLKEILLCSDTELKRWSEDGRLPVMFRRRTPSSVGVTLDVRHWDAALVQEALQHINQWREDDVLAKRRKQGAK